MLTGSFASLYFAILEHEGPQDLYDAVLLPWQETAATIMDYLAPYGSADAIQWRQPTTGGEAQDEFQAALWELYALSRVSDLLLLPFQSHDPAFSNWAGPSITADERQRYLGSLGLTAIDQAAFCPFFHEVAEVEQAPDDDEPISVLEERWPGFMLGQLLICRAGVRVRGGRRHIRKEIAERSTLYWTFRRAARPANDLSHGWGHNSQWRTSFRRDYVDATHLHYNVDGPWPVDQPAPKAGPPKPRDELSIEQRIELVTNRCFVRSTVDHAEQWPYRDTYRERNV